MAFPATPGAEGPFPVEHVGHHRRHQHSHDLGGDRFRLQHGHLEHGEQRDVHDVGDPPDNGEFHQFSVPHGDIAVGLRDPDEHRIDQGHGRSVRMVSTYPLFGSSSVCLRCPARMIG